MKVFFVFFCFFFCRFAFGQNLDVAPATPGATKLKQKATDEVYYVPFRLADSRVERNNVVVNIIPSNGTAVQGYDWDLVTDRSFTIRPWDPVDFPVGIRVRSNRVSKNNTAFTLTFGMVPTTGDAITKTISFEIEPFGTTGLPDTAKWNVRVITGANFDFFDAPTFKNFAGDLNVFLPDLLQFKRQDKKGKKRNDISIGLQAGFFNYRYYDADSSNGNIQTDRYLLDRTVTTLTPGTTKYIHEVYALNSRMNYNTFGAYLNPMIRLTKPETKWVDIYMNLHIEMLWRTQILTYNKATILKDTATYSAADAAQGLVLQRTPGLRPTYTRSTFEDGYYGIGFPVKINIKKAFEFFITPTFGGTSFEGLRVSTDTIGKIIRRTYEKYPAGQYFLMTKAQLVTTLAPIDIALGGEFRKVFRRKAFYAVYLGAVLSLDKFKK